MDHLLLIGEHCTATKSDCRSELISRRQKVLRNETVLIVHAVNGAWWKHVKINMWAAQRLSIGNVTQCPAVYNPCSCCFVNSRIKKFWPFFLRQIRYTHVSDIEKFAEKLQTSQFELIWKTQRCPHYRRYMRTNNFRIVLRKKNVHKKSL